MHVYQRLETHTHGGQIMSAEFKPIKEGKVRQVYDIGDSLIISVTDRISAFDNILQNTIPFKGAVLTKMSRFWFGYTGSIVPNHMLSTDVKDMPEFFQTAEAFIFSFCIFQDITAFEQSLPDFYR